MNDELDKAISRLAEIAADAIYGPAIRELERKIEQQRKTP